VCITELSKQADVWLRPRVYKNFTSPLSYKRIHTDNYSLSHENSSLRYAGDS